MSFKNTIIGGLTAALLSVSAASAAILEFDVSGLFMANEQMGGACCYTPTGTFQLDTQTELLDFVDVTSIHETYSFGSFDSNAVAFGLFSANSDLVLDISNFDYAQILADVAGSMAGDQFFYGADPTEFDNSSGELFGSAVDPTLFMTVIDPNDRIVTPAVPLPAGLPLLLAGLGGFAVLRRKS